MTEFVLLDDCLAGAQQRSHYFYGKVAHIRCFLPDALSTAFLEIEQHRQAGKTVVGFVSYEAGYALDERIAPNHHFSSDFPLLHFMVFEHHEILSADAVTALLDQHRQTASEGFVTHKHLSFHAQEYNAQIERIKQYILDGYTYQVNFTGKYHFDYLGSPVSLYAKLRQKQKVHYGALLHLEEYQILSLSPELFFQKTGTCLTTKPMKGTMPRASDASSDDANQEFLKTDAKSRSENLMIVDLLRNDLSKIAERGSVSVSNLFEVESFETVHQMVSTVQCDIPQETSFDTLIRQLFPCGSITGAPKQKTQQIIHDLEADERKIYTGAIGYVSPDNDFCFNVAIRTLLLSEGEGELGVGSGIVADSNALSEYQEVQLKAKFMEAVDVDFDLIECFLYDSNVGYQYLQEHLSRLSQSANMLGFSFDLQALLTQLEVLKKDLCNQQAYKIKCLLSPNGDLQIMHEPLTADVKNILSITLHPDDTFVPNNPLLQHKTTLPGIRGFYDEQLQAYKAKGFDEVLFLNQQGHLTEGAISNVFLVKNQQWLTPALSCGVLPGILRAKVIQEKQAKEMLLTKTDLLQADEIWLGNSVRGLRQAKLSL